MITLAAAANVRTRLRATAIHTPLLLIIAAYLLYAAAFIDRTALLRSDGQKVYILFDDAMISMVYARNLVRGHGLVWSLEGAPVEGYTNPLWTLYMAAVHLVPGLQPEHTSLVVQGTGALLMALNLVVVKRIAQLLNAEAQRGSLWEWLPSVLLTAAYLPLNNWALIGMEVSLQAPVIGFAVLLALQNFRAGRFTVWPYLLLSVGTLIRIDMIVIYTVVLIVSALVDPAHRGRHLALGVMIVGICQLGLLLFRVLYYGDVLPNTYYLKLSGYPLLDQIQHGFNVTWPVILQLGLPALAVLAFQRSRQVLLLLAVIAGQLAYSVYVGGDAWEIPGSANRYVAIVAPLCFVLLGAAIYRACRWLDGGTFKGDLLSRTARVVLAGGLTVGSHVFVNRLNGALSDPLASPTYYEPHVRGQYDYAMHINAITTPSASVAVTWAGIIPYFTGRSGVDLLGKNDRVIARMPVRTDVGREFRPGHLKWDYSYSIGRLQPDVIVMLWIADYEATPYLGDYTVHFFNGNQMWLRTNSPYILWDKVWLSSAP